MAQELIQHGVIGRGHRHGITNWRVRAESDLALITGLLNTDLDKVAYVVDTDSYWIVTHVDVSTGVGTWKKFL